jgi:predicted RNA-binding Zn-ribbon protein involved in translation (DUF1610 family)
MSEEQKPLICLKCNIHLESMTTVFTYMGYSFNTSMPKCPKCGQVYIPESIVDTKMAEVELQLEDK